jgi:hypothetical protein
VGKLLAYPIDFSSYDRARSESKPGLDPEWYFTRDIYVGSTSSGSHSTWDVSSTFPFSVAIHSDVLSARNDWPKDAAHERSRKLKVEIRTFIEMEISNTVIRTDQSTHYTFVWPPAKDRKEAVIRDVSHGYCVFNFVTEPDAILFKLRFADYVSGISEFHPDYQPDGESFTAKSEWEARTAIQEKWGYAAVPRQKW